MELLLVTNIGLFKAHYNGTQRMNVVKRLLPRNMLDAAEGPVRAAQFELPVNCPARIGSFSEKLYDISIRDPHLPLPIRFKLKACLLTLFAGVDSF